MKKKVAEIIVYVEGGVVQGAMGSLPEGVEVALEVFDVANMKAEAEMSRDDIEKEWEELIKGMKVVY